jgi:ribosomal protein S18 acetylase RimI-like enzyme
MMVSAEHDPRRAGTIWTLSLDGSTPVITPLAPATFCRVESQSAPELAEAMGGDALAEVFRRFETGRRCYAARVDGKLAAYGWVSFDEEFIGELNLRLRLLPGEAYIWNCATLPAFRQNHLYSALLVHIIRELHKEHLSRVWIGADLDNVASQRGIARAGFTYVADLLIARVLTLRQVWVQGRPDVPDSLVAEARRAFLNDRDQVWLKAFTQGWGLWVGSARKLG